MDSKKFIRKNKKQRSVESWTRKWSFSKYRLRIVDIVNGTGYHQIDRYFHTIFKPELLDDELVCGPIRIAGAKNPILFDSKYWSSYGEAINASTIRISSKEKLSKNFWAISGTMASFYELLNVLSNWLIKKKINKMDAQKYVTSLYSALAELALLNSSKPLENLVNEQTPGGLNWQGVNELKKLGYYRLLEKSLRKIYKRL